MRTKKERAHRHDIVAAVQRGVTFQAPHLTLRTVPSNVLKVSFVVPRKIGLNAVARNTLRRRGYAAFRKEYSPTSGTHTMVFFFKRGAERLSFDELRVEIRNVLDKAVDTRYNTQ